jgi:hypothetical protein
MEGLGNIAIYAPKKVPATTSFVAKSQPIICDYTLSRWLSNTKISLYLDVSYDVSLRNVLVLAVGT